MMRRQHAGTPDTICGQANHVHGEHQHLNELGWQAGGQGRTGAGVEELCIIHLHLLHRRSECALYFALTIPAFTLLAFALALALLALALPALTLLALALLALALLALALLALALRQQRRSRCQGADEAPGGRHACGGVWQHDAGGVGFGR